jgi:hypothetical protein
MNNSSMRPAMVPGGRGMGRAMTSRETDRFDPDVVGPSQPSQGFRSPVRGG